MRIPSFTAGEVIQAFRDVAKAILPLESTTAVDWKGRRLIKLGVGTEDTDAATVGQITALRTELGLLTKTPRSPGRLDASGSGQTRIAAFASRGSAEAHIGEWFVASDRNYVAWLSDGSNWTYAYGTESNTLANLRGALTSADVGYRFFVTDYSHLLQWSGSAWQWGAGDVGSGFYQLWEAAPSGYGASAWALCDGSTVARLNADGTTTNVTLDDVATARYLKAAKVSAGVAAASGHTTSDSAGTPAGSVSAPTFTGNAVAAASTNGSPDLVAADGTAAGVSPVTTATGSVSAPTFTGSALGTHNHGPNDLELANLQKRLYFRR